MATTTNYGWTTPDDTALVKDGAAAIRTLGTSVDTTTKALNPSTTLGDIEYRSSTANTNTRLPLGTAGQVLTVNSGATAPEWATASSGGMTLISTTTLSGASVTIGSIPSTYNHLQLVIRNFKPNLDTRKLRLRINNNTGTVYVYSAPTDDSSATAPNSTFIQIGGGADNSVSTNITVFDVYDYANSATWKVTRCLSANVDGAVNTSATRVNATHIFFDTTAVSSLVLFSESGDLTSGTAYLYGVK
jgi:hypothetical protein